MDALSVRWFNGLLTVEYRSVSLVSVTFHVGETRPVNNTQRDNYIVVNCKH